MDVQLPDGTLIRDVPDGMSKADLVSKLKANGHDVSGLEAPQPAGYLDRLKGNTKALGSEAGDVLAGAVRGAGSIGNTIMSAAQVPSDLMAGKGLSLEPWRQRGADMTNALGMMGADTNSIGFKGGKLAGEVAGTAGVGGLLAKGAQGLGAAPEIVNALRTGGFTTGPSRLTTAGNLAVRSGAGAVTGGATVGLASPEDAGPGVIIGGALPGVLKVAGPAGEVLAKGWRSMTQPRTVSAAEDLAKALNAATPEQRAALVAQLKSAPDLITAPTVAQALQTPQASILQRVVYDSPGGGVLRDKIAAQSAARTAALEGVAPTAPSGLAMAREELGQRMERALVPERAKAIADVSAKYRGVDPTGQVRLQLPLDEMQAASDKYLGPGTFGQGGETAAALKAAREIGSDTTAPLITNMKQPASTELTLGSAVRRLGISPDELKSGMSGEVRYLKESKFGKGLVNKNGRSLDDIAERMHADGYLDSPDPHELVQKLTDEASGSPVMSRFGDPARMARDAGMPDKLITAGTSTPRPVDWETLQNFRSSVGSAAFKAKLAGSDRDAGALREIKNALSSRVDEAAGQGLLRDGESFPADAYARWTDANASHAARKERFDTGPLSGMFRAGRDGEPILQGEQIAKRAWGSAENVGAFKKLVGDHKDLLGDFKSMVTTEGAATADAAGNLTTKFSKWVDKTLPGLKEAFSPDEVKTLQRIAADIDRHAAAVKAGTSLGGSNTYQNATNALSLGVLDSPALGAIAGRAPVIGRLGGMALDGVRGYARNSKAERLAELLADRDAAVNALTQVGQPALGTRQLNALAPAIYRAGPGAGRRN